MNWSLGNSGCESKSMLFGNSVSESNSMVLVSNEMALEAMEMLSQASHTDLAFEWSMLCQDCTDCWTQTGETLYYDLSCFVLNLTCM
jgi:hypothetical protein